MKQCIVTSIVLLMLVLTGCGSVSMSGVDVQVTAGQPAALGGIMIVRATVTSVIDAPDAEVWFDLTPGLAAPADKLRQKTQLQANVSQTFELPVQLLQAGEQRVGASASIYIGGGSFGDFAALYLEVGSTDTIVRKESLTPIPVMPTQDSLTMDEIEKLLTTPTPEPPSEGDHDTPTPVP